jgi:hypothetical protein
MQEEKICYFTGTQYNLDKHHIYFGSNRKVSDDNGFWVWLAHDRHIQYSRFSTPHNNKEIDLYLKKLCQEKYEEENTRESFMKIIGRNYL